MTLEKQIELMEDKLEEILPLVKEIHTIVIGSEHNRNDSLLTKIAELRDEVNILKNDKLTRDASNKVYMFLIGIIGSLLGSILSGTLVYFLTHK
jgi:low affinity Fe/Cu permease